MFSRIKGSLTLFSVRHTQPKTKTMYEYNELYALSCATTSTTMATSSSDYRSYDTLQFSDSSPPIYHPPPHSYPPPPPLVLPTNEFDSSFPILKSEFGYSSSSSYSSPCSLPNYHSQQLQSLVQRSLSSHSLQKEEIYHHHPIFSYLDESHPESFDLDSYSQDGSSSIRKVFSTGDLQGTNMAQNQGPSDSPLSNEAAIIEGMNKVGRYSAEERKERIERYRSKRNQRNFNKKIKYACRKTLADSRPRIRGRFARNDEIGESSQVQWGQLGGEENEEEDDLWLNLFDTFTMSLVP